MKRAFFYLLIIPLLLSISCAKKDHHKELPPVAVTAVMSKTKDVPLYVQTVGHIEGYNTVDIQSQITGVLTNTYFEQGGHVKKGDLLATIDDRPYIAALEQAKAELDESLAELKYAQDTTRRNTPLVQDDYISENSYEQLVTNVLVDEATVKEKMAAVETAKINLGYCYIYAPMDAIASDRIIDPGNLLLAENPQTILTLQQIKPIYCVFYISEKVLPQVQRLNKQNSLSIEVSYNEEFKDVYTGTLCIIDNTVNTSTGMIKLKGCFTNEDEILWPGEYINVRLVLEMLKNAVLVPEEALQNGSKGKFIYVVNKDSTVEKRLVKTGQREGNDIIILEGLNPGETVVTEGQFNLFPGAKVSIKNKKTP